MKKQTNTKLSKQLTALIAFANKPQPQYLVLREQFKPGDVVKITGPFEFFAPKVREAREKCIGMYGIVKRRSRYMGMELYLKLDKRKLPALMKKQYRGRKWISFDASSVTNDAITYMKYKKCQMKIKD